MSAKRKNPDQAFDRGAKIAVKMLTMGKPTEARIRAAIEPLVERSDADEIAGFRAALRAVAVTGWTPAPRPPKRRASKKPLTAASFEIEMARNLDLVRRFKAFMKTMSPTDPRVLEELAYLQKMAATWRNQRERFEAKAEELDLSARSREEALQMARILREGEEELGEELGHRLQ